ncbi:Hyalin [Holothuria leucospilota]|uniref:Hyalin n=1 Tax=Holothuria leucospilota TaxID=206669 RepID=A0A9Q0YHS1_HOLLE|nr:Hyalin [Holothuria leucospilota]
MVNWINPSPLNPENVYLVFQSHMSQSSFFPLGETTVCYIFADDYANIANCSFKIVLYSDITYCPMNIHRVIPVNGPDEVEVVWEEPRAEDSDGLVTITRQSAFPGQTFRVNTQTSVLYEFSDEQGNLARCSFMVVVIKGDDMPPDIQGCPGDIVVTISNEFSSSLVSWVEPSTEEDDVTIERSHDSGSLFTLGDTLVTYNFTDLEGLSAMCTFVVSIIRETLVVDNLPPSITYCPTDFILEPDPVTGEAVATWTLPLVEDDTSVVFLLNEPPSSGSSFPAGSTTEITYVYSDISGNVASCSFSITVNEFVPTLDCPENMTIEIQADEAGASPSWEEPTIFHSGFVVVGSRSPGYFIEAGVTVITYSLYGQGGLISECSFYVNIVLVKDVTPPEVFNCPTLGVSSTLEPGATSRTVFWLEPIAVDDSGPVFLKSQTASPGDIFEAGKTTVTYRFEDSSGNAATCTFVVNVITVGDTSPPVISDCPVNITVYVFPDWPDPAVQWKIPSATDDVSSVRLVPETHRPGDVFPRGGTLVTYTFVDEAENVATCSFGIFVTEIETPEVVRCPSTISLGIESGQTGTTVNWQEPYVTTDLNLQNISRSHFPESFFPLGQTEVIYSFTFIEVPKFNLNCTFLINITQVDEIPPTVIYCPGNIKKLINNHRMLPKISWLEPLVTDDLGNVTVSLQSHTSGTIFPEGETEILYQFMDESRNNAECRFKVTVEFMRAALIIPVTFNIEEEFTVDLLEVDSSTYTTLEERLKNGISGVVMSRRQIRNTFGGLSVVQLRPGSIAAETDLWFHSSIPVNDVTSFIDNLFQNSLRNSFGFLGDLRIKSIEIGIPQEVATTLASITTEVSSPSTETPLTTFDSTITFSTTQMGIMSRIAENETSTMPQTTKDTRNTTRKETPGEQENQTKEPAISFLTIVILSPIVASVLLLIISILIFACRVCHKEKKYPQPKPRSRMNHRTTDHPLGMVTEPVIDDSTAERDAREEERFIDINRQFEIIDEEVERENVHSGEEPEED